MALMDFQRIIEDISGGDVDRVGLDYARQADTHEDAIDAINQIAAAKSLGMQQLHQNYAKGNAEQQISQYKKSTRDARHFAGAQIGGLHTNIMSGMGGWTENMLMQMNPEGVGSGAGLQAMQHLGAIQEAVSLGVVKDLADLQ